MSVQLQQNTKMSVRGFSRFLPCLEKIMFTIMSTKEMVFLDDKFTNVILCLANTSLHLFLCRHVRLSNRGNGTKTSEAKSFLSPVGTITLPSRAQSFLIDSKHMQQLPSLFQILRVGLSQTSSRKSVFFLIFFKNFYLVSSEEMRYLLSS